MLVLVLPLLLEVGYWKATIAIVNFRWKFAKHRKSEKYHVTEFPECLDNFSQIKTKVAQKCRSCKETVLMWWRHEVIILKFHGKHTKTTVGSDFKVSKQFLVLQMLHIELYIMRVGFIGVWQRYVALEPLTNIMGVCVRQITNNMSLISTIETRAFWNDQLCAINEQNSFAWEIVFSKLDTSSSWRQPILGFTYEQSM